MDKKLYERFGRLIAICTEVASGLNERQDTKSLILASNICDDIEPCLDYIISLKPKEDEVQPCVVSH